MYSTCTCARTHKRTPFFSFSSFFSFFKSRTSGKWKSYVFVFFLLLFFLLFLFLFCFTRIHVHIIHTQAQTQKNQTKKQKNNVRVCVFPSSLFPSFPFFPFSLSFPSSLCARPKSWCGGGRARDYQAGAGCCCWCWRRVWASRGYCGDNIIRG